MEPKVENKEEKTLSRRDIRRKELIKLSKIARAKRDEEGLDCTLNEIIIDDFYTDDEHQEFHLLRDWNEKGYKVKKGSKAFTIWGKKRTVENTDPDSEEDEYKFFPLAYLFSNAQVEKR